MQEEKKAVGVPAAMTNTDLAFQRTTLAYERTLTAWIRTATSMISFGFTIYKFFQVMNRDPSAPHRLFTPRFVGMLLISFGLLSLLFAQIQHQKALKRLKQEYPKVQRSLSSVLSLLILLFGFALFLGALFRQ